MIRRSFAGALAALLSAGGAAGAAGYPAPDLDTAVTVLVAGGGPANFKTTTLVAMLAGANAGDDLAQLARRIGAPALKRCIAILDDIVGDAQRRIAQHGYRLPPAPALDAVDAKALAGALYRAGRGTASAPFDSDAMLDRLVTRPIRVAIMRDVDATYGTAAAGVYRRAVQSEMLRLKDAYAL